MPLGDGLEQDQSLCLFPVQAPSGMVLPKCLEMITAQEVIQAVEHYLKFESFAWRTIYRQQIQTAATPVLL